MSSFLLSVATALVHEQRAASGSLCGRAIGDGRDTANAVNTRECAHDWAQGLTSRESLNMGRTLHLQRSSSGCSQVTGH